MLFSKGSSNFEMHKGMIMCNKGKLKCVHSVALFRNVYWLIDSEFKWFLHIVKYLHSCLGGFSFEIG